MAKLKAGVIGVGALGRHHARLYKMNEKVEVAGVFDVSGETARKVGEEFGLPVYSNWRELAEKCDLLSVAVPAIYHEKCTLPLLEMGKHVLVEKPMAVSEKEAQNMLEAANSRNLVLAVGHTERFNPAMAFLEKNSHGAPRYIEAHRMAPYPPPRPGAFRRGTEVSVVLDLMIHDIDLVLTMVNAEVEKFDAVGISVLSDSEDIVAVRLKFANGSVANMTSSRVSAEPLRKFRVFEEDGYISMDYAGHTGMVLRKNHGGMERQDVVLDEKNALFDELDNFVDAVAATVATGKVHPAKVTGEQGMRALKLALAIQEEIRRYNKQYGINFTASILGELAKPKNEQNS